MNSTTITAILSVGCFAVGAGGTVYYMNTASTPTHIPTVGQDFSSTESIAEHYSPAHLNAIPADESTIPNENLEGTTAKQQQSRQEFARPTLTIEGFHEKVVKESGRYVYRSFRVDVLNDNDFNVDAYIQVEWLDAEGFRVQSASQTMTLAPEMNSVSGTRMFDLQENSRVKSFRVIKADGKPATESPIRLLGLKEKLTKRSGNYFYRSWLIELANDSNFPVDGYIEVEWLDSEGHHVSSANESRSLAPGKNVITETRIFDMQENARVKSFRVVKISHR